MNKNKHLENATNYLLKTCGDGNGAVPRKIVRELQQLGLDLNCTGKSPSKIKSSSRLNSKPPVSPQPAKQSYSSQNLKAKPPASSENEFLEVDSWYRPGHPCFGDE